MELEVPLGKLALPVAYLSSSANPFDSRPGAQVHFFIPVPPAGAKVDTLPDCTREPLYLALLDPTEFPAAEEEQQQRQLGLLGGDALHFDGILGAVRFSLVRMLNIGQVKNLLVDAEDMHRLREGIARPPLPPGMALLKPADIVPLLPLLLCNTNAPILMMVMDHDADIKNCRVIKRSANGNAQHHQAAEHVACVGCSLLPESVLQRKSQCPAVQAALYRRFLLQRTLRAKALDRDRAMGNAPDAPAMTSMKIVSTLVTKGVAEAEEDGGKGSNYTVRLRSPKAVAAITRCAEEWWAFVAHVASLDKMKADALMKHPDFQGPAIKEDLSRQQLNFLSRLHRLGVIANRRRLLLTVDTSAGAAALQDFHSQVVIATLQTIARDAVYRAVGYVTDFVGAAMSYQTNWTLIEHPELGSAMRRQHFLLDPSIVMLDGNRYGILPKPVREARMQWESRVHMDPVLWRFKAFPPRLNSTLAKMGQRLNVVETDLQLFGTLRHAMATVLRSLPLQPGDSILVFGPCSHLAIVHHITTVTGAIARVANLLEPLGDDADVSLHFKQCLKQTQPKAVIIQHLMPTGRPLPLSRFVADCRDEGCMCIVDGTDALGNIDFSLSQLGVDFYVSRLDGYFFCPVGTSLLFTNPLRQPAVSTLTVSYFHGEGYSKEWTYTGLMDMTAWVSILQAIQFQTFLCSGYLDYIVYLANAANRFLCEVWRVEPITPQPLRSGIFAVLLPGMSGSEEADAFHFQAILAQSRVHVAVFPLAFRDGTKRLAGRITCNVYNDMTDIKRLATAVLNHAVSTMRLR